MAWLSCFFEAGPFCENCVSGYYKSGGLCADCNTSGGVQSRAAAVRNDREIVNDHKKVGNDAFKEGKMEEAKPKRTVKRGCVIRFIVGLLLRQGQH